MKLYINKDVIVINNKHEDNTFIYNRKKHIKYIVNEDMFDILEHIYTNEGITLKDITKTYIDIEDTINDLINLEIICTTKQARYYNVKKVGKLNTARLFVELTDKCNLRCKHCYGDFKLENCQSLDIETLKSIIAQAKELNIYQFDLTGGEPLLYKNLKEVLKTLYEAGMLVTIFTNLTVQNEKIISLLEKYCVKKIITSIDSCHHQNHDEFRGVKGALQNTLNNIPKIKEKSIELSVNTMVGTHNENDIEETILFLKDLKVPCVLDAIVPNGRANNLQEDMFKSVQLIHDLYDNKELNVELKITDCGVGQRFMYIKSNGNVCLCPSLITDKFIFSNIYDKDFSLLKSWQKMNKLYGDLRCKKDCSKKDLCNGGCRARALLFKNDLYDKDLNSCILSGECRANEIK